MKDLNLKEREFKRDWSRVQNWMKNLFKRKSLPNLNFILFIIGVEEFGKRRREYSFKERQKMRQIAIYRLLSYDGFYKLMGKDKDGYPKWDVVKPFTIQDDEIQKRLLKMKIVQYFKEEIGIL